jgi:hypothetical protein
MGSKKSDKTVNKLGIYVPENRLEQIEKWKDKIILSELFWRAWDHEIARRTASAPKGTQMQKLIERLKKEASEDCESGEQAGAECGKEWAVEFASARHIRMVADERLPPKFDDAPAFLASEYANDYGESNWRTELITENGVSDPKAFFKGFTIGFIKAVGEIYQRLPADLQ